MRVQDDLAQVQVALNRFARRAQEALRKYSAIAEDERKLYRDRLKFEFVSLYAWLEMCPA